MRVKNRTVAHIPGIYLELCAECEHVELTFAIEGRGSPSDPYECTTCGALALYPISPALSLMQ